MIASKGDTTKEIRIKDGATYEDLSAYTASRLFVYSADKLVAKYSTASESDYLEMTMDSERVTFIIRRSDKECLNPSNELRGEILFAFAGPDYENGTGIESFKFDIGRVSSMEDDTTYDGM